MFREGTHINYVAKGFGGYHEDTFIRNRKSSFYTKDASDIKKEINDIKYQIYRLEKKMNLSKEEENKLIQYKKDLVFWQNEMCKFDNLPSHKRLKTCKKKVKPTKLKNQVLSLIDEAISNETYFVYKEDCAYRLQVKVKDLDKIFMELNREGVLSQAQHKFMHDSNRGYSPLLPGEQSDWRGDIYYIRK